MSEGCAITPLDGWIVSRISAGTGGLERLAGYQTERLRETLRLVKSRSRFYADLLRGIDPDAITSPDSLAELPFTTPEMLAGRGEDFMCSPPGDAARVVTLPTSGTTGAPKRVCFTPEDIELTRDFFHWGMKTLVSAGERVMIFMPGATENGVGALLREALQRLGCEGIVYGAITDPADAARALADTGCKCAVGLPSQVYEAAVTGARGVKVESVLLSADYAPRAVSEGISRVWGCRVFDHYGMTEMGFGGGVECSARNGYHMREADMIFEIIDPHTGRPARAGEYGEVVFTTLTRRGMPLVRYRTGDRSRRLPGGCPCGTELGRLERVSGRVRDAVRLRSGGTLAMSQLDDVVYMCPGVAAYCAAIVTRAGGADCLALTVRPADGARLDADALSHMLRSSEGLRGLCGDGAPPPEIRTGEIGFRSSGALKRRISDMRDINPPEKS
ncbi:MAG: AMP-binding protein [Oscillospiraceae bacterium]|jgi:phenylacetate-coenzyme A ligase PaaK-like adenylate-forming protein|nr:AMP-binding protein [Oscillospiraceae bacterium]